MKKKANPIWRWVIGAGALLLAVVAYKKFVKKKVAQPGTAAAPTLPALAAV